jgi:hypothetical protein
VGVDGRLGSRLLGRRALTGNSTTLKALLKQTTPVPWAILGNLVASPGVREVVIAGGGNAVNPAWRTAYVHFSNGSPRSRCVFAHRRTPSLILGSYPTHMALPKYYRQDSHH